MYADTYNYLDNNPKVCQELIFRNLFSSTELQERNKIGKCMHTITACCVVYRIRFTGCSSLCFDRVGILQLS